MTTEQHDLVSLQDAADELGVHYQTAYRWVRAGRLRASLVDGKYWVDPADIDGRRAERAEPTTPTTPGAARLLRQAAAMADALIEGDEKRFRSVGRSLVDHGTTRIELITEAVVPALRRIGEEWSAGQLPIWVEHRASSMVERLLGELAPTPKGRRRGRVLVAAVSGDRHGLPATMATTVLREANWNVDHLGADMPPDEIVAYATSHDIDVVVLTSTNPDTRPTAAATAERLDGDGIPSVVGRPGATLHNLLTEVAAAATKRRRTA